MAFISDRQNDDRLETGLTGAETFEKDAQVNQSHPESGNPTSPEITQRPK
jgi:hypothetical protein